MSHASIIAYTTEDGQVLSCPACTPTEVADLDSTGEVYPWTADVERWEGLACDICHGWVIVPVEECGDCGLTLTECEGGEYGGCQYVEQVTCPQCGADTHTSVLACDLLAAERLADRTP